MKFNKIARSSAGAERARLNFCNRAGARSARALKKYERAHLYQNLQAFVLGL